MDAKNDRQETGRPGVFIYRTPLGQRLLGAFSLVLLAPVALGMAVFAVLLVGQNGWVVTIVFVCAFVMCGLVIYLARDVRAKWALSIECAGDQAILHLPRDRSLVHRPTLFDGAIPYADISALETRLEAYGSLGMQVMQRSYAIRRRSGEVLILGEDRALATGLAQAGIGLAFEALRARSGAPVIDRGMVKGRGGLLLVVGAAPDAWNAPSLDPARQALLWRRAAATGLAPIPIFLAVWALKAVFGF